jgi:DNA-binding MarR family transcriptional regulator
MPAGKKPQLSAAQRFPVSFAVFALARTHRALAATMLRGLGLFPGQEIMLLQLWDRDGQSQSELGETLGVDHSTVAKSVRRLADAGLISCQRSTADRRVTVVSLTPAGRALEAKVADVWGELERRTVAGLDSAQRARFVELAQAVENSIDSDTGEA